MSRATITSTSRTISACAAGAVEGDRCAAASRCRATITVQSPECCVQIYVRYGRDPAPLNRGNIRRSPRRSAMPPPSTNAVRSRDRSRCRAQRAQRSRRRLAARRIGTSAAGTLTSVSAWRFWDWGRQNDRDFTGLPITTCRRIRRKQNQVHAGAPLSPAKAMASTMFVGSSLSTRPSTPPGRSSRARRRAAGCSIRAGRAAALPTSTALACDPACSTG
jgi:hypothetical protein